MGTDVKSLKQIVMELLHNLLGFRTRHQEAQVMAGCPVTNHADIERIQDAKHLFTYATGF